MPPMVRPTPNQAKLAAIAVDLNIRLRSADMPGAMQERSFRCTRAILDANLEKKPNPTRIAMCLKKEFDEVYGPAWHCVVGQSFGSFVTHSSGGFVYFSVDKLSFLLFKTEVRPVRSSLPLPPRPPPPPPPPPSFPLLWKLDINA
ncbi:dynein light chain, cytoplasmic [Manihot esculenta]|nr:dynein light chain, cytoplasmic [Manihot esculenta]